jgi:hypothetical protein
MTSTGQTNRLGIKLRKPGIGTCGPANEVMTFVGPSVSRLVLNQ